MSHARCLRFSASRYLPIDAVDQRGVLGYAFYLASFFFLQIFGAACSAGTALLAGPEDGATFAAGVLAGAAYLLLLERNTDRVGTAAAQVLRRARKKS